MDLFTGILLFFVIWWIAIFMVLPFGLKRDERGYPDDPRMKAKVIQITVLSAIIWIFIYAVVESDLISFREIADAMVAKDYGS